MDNFSESDKEFLDFTNGERKNLELSEPCMSELNGDRLDFSKHWDNPLVVDGVKSGLGKVYDEAEGLTQEAFEAAMPKTTGKILADPVYGTGGDLEEKSLTKEKPGLYELVYESYHMLLELKEKKDEKDLADIDLDEELKKEQWEMMVKNASIEEMYERVKSANEELLKILKLRPDFPIELLSDGYHTFKELYEFRLLYNAALFNEWAKDYMQQHNAYKGIDKNNLHPEIKLMLKNLHSKYNVHKSWNHHDGEPCFGGGWFIVSAMLPDGLISNHYKAKYWEYFKVPETEKALFEFDGHTSEDVQKRITDLILGNSKKTETN